MTLITNHLNAVFKLFVICVKLHNNQDITETQNNYKLKAGNLESPYGNLSQTEGIQEIVYFIGRCHLWFVMTRYFLL
jgi:hypothetical protein